MEIAVPQALIALGAVAAALIAGFFSYLNLVISKEQKVSEFRQQWIDSLREEIALYVGSVNYYIWADQYLNQRSDDTVTPALRARELRTAIVTASQCYTAIILRLNPHEADATQRMQNAELLEALKITRDAIENGDHPRASGEIDSIRKAAQPLLKSEWERVKRGERTYQIAKFIAIILFLIGIFASVVLFFQAMDKSSAEESAMDKSKYPTRVIS